MIGYLMDAVEALCIYLMPLTNTITGDFDFKHKTINFLYIGIG
jgi:hypothetical protein